MKLSAIVPVYNTEAYLCRCIDSILGQSYTNFELILIDDGSADQSYELCQSYARKDPRIIVLHQENQGQASARNKGLDVAQGDFVTFIDSDDSVDTDMFRYMMDAATTHDADIVTCELELIWEDRPRATQTKELPGDVLVSQQELLYNFYHTDGKQGYTTGVVCGKVYRKQLFDTLRFPIGWIYEDTYIIPYLFEQTKMMVITYRPFYKYWIRTGSTVNGQFREKHLDALYVMYDQYRFFLDRPQYGQTHLAQNTYVRYFTRYYYLVHLLHPGSKPALKPYTKQFRRMLPSIMKNPLICKMEKLCILCMLLAPKAAITATRKYFPESLPKELLQ